MDIYVGNLAYKTQDADLENLFASFGTVQGAKVMSDKFTGRSKGFGFVNMPNAEEADAAVAKLNGTDFMGRNIVVNPAKPRS